jgi:hypothetical protein
MKFSSNSGPSEASLRGVLLVFMFSWIFLGEVVTSSFCFSKEPALGLHLSVLLFQFSYIFCRYLQSFYDVPGVCLFLVVDNCLICFRNFKTVDLYFLSTVGDASSGLQHGTFCF